MNIHILSLMYMLNYLKCAKCNDRRYNCLDFIQWLKYIQPKEITWVIFEVYNQCDMNIWIHAISYWVDILK